LNNSKESLLVITGPGHIHPPEQEGLVMVLGIVELELHIPDTAALKGKRRVVKRVIERTRARFNASVAEVDKQDVYSAAVIGCAVVGSDRRYVNGALDKILDFVSEISIAEVSSEKIEIISL